MGQANSCVSAGGRGGKGKGGDASAQAAAAQDSFDEDYMQVLKMRALESLDVYEFE